MALATLSTKITSEIGAAIDIYHPTTNLPLGIAIVVCGTDSDSYKTIQRKQLNRRLEQQKKRRGNQLSMTAEELEAEAMDVLVACTKGWATGDRLELELNTDEWLPCTPENVRRVYEELPWLKEQIDQAIGDRTNFLQG